MKGREWHCLAQASEFVCVQMPALQVDVRLVPGPRLDLLGCLHAATSLGCGSNPGDQTVGARRTRGGLASPDWLEKEEDI